jgi:hypothetical protein
MWGFSWRAGSPELQTNYARASRVMSPQVTVGIQCLTVDPTTIFAHKKRSDKRNIIDVAQRIKRNHFQWESVLEQSHHTLQTADRIDGRVMRANLTMLFCLLSLVPFVIRWMDDSGFERVALSQLWPRFGHGGIWVYCSGTYNHCLEWARSIYVGPRSWP